jgi:hypothetical protein
MTESEWVEVVGRINANWPHQIVPDAALAKWYDDLKDLPVGYVTRAVEDLYHGGREFPPNGGQIRKRAAEMQVDAPTFAEVWRLVLRAASKFGRDRVGEARAWLRERHPVAEELVRRVGWREICNSEELEVLHGQARRVYEALTAQTVHETTVRGVDSGGLRQGERINAQPVPMSDVINNVRKQIEG